MTHVHYYVCPHPPSDYYTCVSSYYTCVSSYSDEIQAPRVEYAECFRMGDCTHRFLAATGYEGSSRVYWARGLACWRAPLRCAVPLICIYFFVLFFYALLFKKKWIHQSFGGRLSRCSTYPFFLSLFFLLLMLCYFIKKKASPESWRAALPMRCTTYPSHCPWVHGPCGFLQLAD